MHCFHSTRFHLSVDCWIQTISQESTRKSWQRQSFVDNVLINLWQCRMEINNVKPQSIDLWQCYININKVDLKLLSSCSINQSWQCWSDFDITLSFVDQSSFTFQLVVASSNNNTLPFDDSANWASATFKLVVVSITIESSKVHSRFH